MAKEGKALKFKGEVRRKTFKLKREEKRKNLP
jgi:hypothetical protein